MPTGVVLLGDAAATLAPRFVELGLETAQDLEARPGDRTFVLGVGAEAHAALLCAASDDLAGVIGIDGTPPLDEARAGTLRAPVLAIVAEDDEGAAYSFAKALGHAGVLNETVVYDGVARGFLGVHEQATEDVWRLVRRFMGVPLPA